MLLKSSLLLLFIVSIGDTHVLTPFDLVDNYVEQFRAHVDQLINFVEKYQVKEEEYDVLSLEDSKLLLSEYTVVLLFELFISVHVTNFNINYNPDYK